jgi:hypothetical protein
MGLHDPFGYFKHKLWLKEEPEVKLVIWFPTIKSQESTDFHVCRWRAIYRWKTLNKGYNFSLDLTSIGGLHTKLRASKVARVPILGSGSLGTKWHLGVGPMAKHREYYKGEGDGFPQVRAMVTLVSLCLPMVSSCTKSALAMH